MAAPIIDRIKRGGFNTLKDWRHGMENWPLMPLINSCWHGYFYQNDEKH
jgi:hypothetical protein